MGNLPIQDLERAKFTSDSNENESTVRTSITGGEVGEDGATIDRDNLRYTKLICKADRIIELLEKIDQKLFEMK